MSTVLCSRGCVFVFATMLGAGLVTSVSPGHAVETGQPTNSVADASFDLLKRGEEALRNLQYDQARRDFDAAMASGSLTREQQAIALLNRALARQNLGESKGAISDYSAAVKIGTLPPPAVAIAYFNRGLAHNTLGDTNRALDDLSLAIKTNPSFSQAYNSRATLLRILGRHQDAVADYRSAIKYLYPKPHLAHYGQALSHIALRQTEQAKTALSASLRANPDFALARDKAAELNAVVEPAGAPADGGMEVNARASLTGAAAKGDENDEQSGAGTLPRDGYVVQIMAQRERALAESSWEQLSRRHAELLGEMRPIIERADLGRKGVVFRVKTGPFEDRASAQKLCAALKKRGQDCFTATVR